MRDLHLAADMPYEGGLIDGDLPHALERVLPTSVLVAGYKLADSESYEALQAREGATGIAHSTGAGPLGAVSPRLNGLVRSSDNFSPLNVHGPPLSAAGIPRRPP